MFVYFVFVYSCVFLLQHICKSYKQQLLHELNLQQMDQKQLHSEIFKKKTNEKKFFLKKIKTKTKIKFFLTFGQNQRYINSHK